MAPPSTPVLILGMHRSGTSSLAGILREQGLNLGDVSEANRHNPKGNQESKVVRIINEDLLDAAGGSWYEPVEVQTAPGPIAGRIREFKAEMAGAGGLWGIKDPRMLFCLPAWGLDGARYVGTVRHPAAVVRSLRKRNGARKRPLKFDGWEELYLSHNRRLLRRYEERPFPIVSFDWEPERYLASVLKLAEYLDLEGREARFFDPSLRNHRPEEEEITGEVREVYETLVAIAEQEDAKLAGKG